MSSLDRLAGDLSTSSFTAPSGAIFGHARKRSLSKPKAIVADISPASDVTISPRGPAVREGAPQFKTAGISAARMASQKQSPRPDSPDVETILAKTPRPRRRSSATFNSPLNRLRSRSHSTLGTGSTKSSTSSGQGMASESLTDVSDYGVLLQQDTVPEENIEEEGDGSESDSSIDVHTPLP